MKFSTIGTSWITDLFIEAAKKVDIKLASIYSRTEENAKQFAEKHGAEKYYTNLDELLTAESDFIYIASPNSLHYEHILKCIEYKKHVFCEKPLVINQAQWNDIQNKARNTGVYIFEGYRHLFTPNYKMLKKYLHKVGPVRNVLLPFCQYSSRYDAFKIGEQPNVFTKEFAGGVLMDLGVYPLSMALDLFGEPEDISYYPVLLENGIDGSGTMVLKYNQFIVTLIFSKITHSMLSAEIQGENGILTMDHLADTKKIEFIDRPNNMTIDLTQPMIGPDMVYELEAFIQMIQQADRVQHDAWLERSRQIVKWSERARKSVGIIFSNEKI